MGKSLSPWRGSASIPDLRRAAAFQLTILGGALIVAVVALVPAAPLGWRGGAAALALYGAIAALVLAGLTDHAPHRAFGLANRVTLLRAVYTALLAGFAIDGGLPSEALRNAVAVTGLAALALDGVDGWAARRSGLASRFGARFDMEVDALFVLALSALVFESGQAGIWVLTSGMMRYIFVGAGRLWPPLAAELPPSRRRKLVCVVQTVALLWALTPLVSSGLGTDICAIGLTALTASFGVDCIMLVAAEARARQRSAVGVDRC